MARHTQQRQTIIDCFEKTGRPLSPNEVHKLCETSDKQPGIATVYRTINMLLEDGRLEIVELPDESPRYEMAGLNHHHHFLCRKCDKVFDVHDCKARPKDMTPKGFKLERHEIWLYGLCANCRT